MLFWYTVVRPYPARPVWVSWLLVPVLLVADLSNTALSALLTFSDRVIYPYYSEVPRLAGVFPLGDQALAGVLMWVPGSVAFLLPLFGICVGLLSGQRSEVRSRKRAVRTQPLSGRISLPLARSPLTSEFRPPTSGFDLLRAPLLSRFLRWRHARLAFQIPALALAGLVIYDGLTGPQVAPMNLAGVLPWIHWRGLAILALLAVGNVFCMACPFVLPRTLARRWLPQARSWPRWLRSKWPAFVLLALFLWAYEAFSLWDSPWLTAWIAVGYFIGALVIDGIFRGAAFCKYVCPLGQFNFVQSLVSPLEVTVRDPEVCAGCRTKDCIRGGNGVPGCELGLFQPRKASNMDCTFCLDCVHACPHDNIGIVAKAPGQELWKESWRSGIGRFGSRPDLAALILVLVFGAFANAAGMVAPVLAWRDQLSASLDQRSPMLSTSLFYVTALLVIPALIVGAVAVLSCRWGNLQVSPLRTATRFSYGLVPLGLSMWLAHYLFHFLSSFDTAIPALQRFAGDLGLAGIGEPEWSCACCRPVVDWLPRLEIMFLDLGLLFSLYSSYRIALAFTSRLSQVLRTLAPWAILTLFLFLMGVWIVLQPMEMRGTLSISSPTGSAARTG
jgi:polyferredoxin